MFTYFPISIVQYSKHKTKVSFAILFEKSHILTKAIQDSKKQLAQRK